MRTPDAILAELEVFGIRLGLESTRALLAAAGDPQSRCPVILVGGTNGKGSTSSLLATILAAAGLRVGLYTSPHLEDVGERIRVSGRAIAPLALAEELERVVASGRRILGHPPTYFEALTVAAYSHFAAASVEVAVMEVGLGGRLDATNAADPVLSIVTSISLDHVKVLGATLDLIAREKAGILRSGRTALHGVEAPEARVALELEAASRGARLLDAATLARSVEAPAATGRRVLLETPSGRYHLELGLRGGFQTRNLTLGVLAAELLRAEAGLAVDAAAIERGVRGWRWPGRCELVVLPGGVEVLLDAAHNEDGVASLGSDLDSGWPGSGPSQQWPWRLLFGALDDKPAGAMVARLAAGAERVVLTRPPSPRGLDPGRLLPAVGDVPVSVVEDPAAALEAALAGGARRLVVCGSIYLVGEVRRELRRRFGVPPPATEPWLPDTGAPASAAAESAAPVG